MTARRPSGSRSRSSIRPSATSPATPPRCARRAPRRRGLGADLVMFPELFLAGYPPEDLVLKPAFQDACREACEALARETGDGGPAVLVGLPWAEDGGLYNAYALLDGGQIAALRFKVDLPNYGVFDEKRVFAPGPLPGPVGDPRRAHRHSGLRGHLGRRRRRVPRRDRRRDPARAERLALLARQDRRAHQHRRRPRDRERAAARLSQPGRRPGRARLRRRLLRRSTPTARSPASCRRSARRSRSRVWEQGRRRLALPRGAACELVEEGDEADYAACVLGLARLCRQERLSRAWCSAFPAASIRRSAPRWRSMRSGADRVHCVMLPYRYTSNESLDDAAECAEALGVRYDIVPIAAPRRRLRGGARSRCSPGARATSPRRTSRARARGTILMAISNKFGPMVVTTGNKSEMSVGYATLYGDMNGGFNPIKDLYKMEVYRLSALRNRWKPAGALGPDGVVDPGEHHRQGADGGAAREPEGPGLAAALRRARRHPRMPGRARDARSARSWRAATTSRR